MRSFRKPLVVAAPKIGLKHPKAVSDIGELADGKFEPIITSGDGPKVALCSGKIAFDLEA